MSKNKIFYNAHTHVFTFDNVPNQFLKRVVPIIGRIDIHKLMTFDFFRDLLKVLRRLIFWSDTDALDRIVNFIEHGRGKNMPDTPLTQEAIFNNLRAFYPSDTRFIVLSMDMEYMSAGRKMPANYKKQTADLEKLKHKYEELIYPFVFVDPRRVTDNDDPASLKGAPFFNYVREKITDKTFAGIKIYPALGYWPFCEDMKEVYNFAIDNSIPILSHCSGGPVYYRGRKKDKTHPVYNNIKLEGCRNGTFTRHYSNPLNYHMLMDKTILQKHWGEDAPDYGKLKICLGHFGGLDDWMNYLQNPWLAPFSLKENPDSLPALDEANWCFKKGRKTGEYTWFSVICSLIKKYDNIYADISSTLHDERTYPLLKVLLETDEKLRERILFGTDFYMVSLARSEKEFSLGLRGYLGEELFHRIACTNVETFLSSKFSP